MKTTIARYELEDITTGVALYEAKKQAGTLPEGVDVRYLWGIVKNVAREREIGASGRTGCV